MAGLLDTLMQRKRQYQTGTTGQVEAMGNGLMDAMRPDITDPLMRKKMGLPPLPSAAETGTPEQEAFIRQLMMKYK